jgi:probable rRNA maturation factor
LIEVAISDDQITLVVDGDRLRSAIAMILSDSGRETATISLAIVDDPTIHELNRRFLKHDYPTDVLSFVLEDDGQRLDGEIIVSADYAARSAPDYGWSAEDELLLYVIHGTLHLVGFDDLDDEPRAEMRKRERHYLGQMGVKLPASEGRGDEPGRATG